MANNELSLRLEAGRQAWEELQFHLMMENRSDARIFLPWPGMEELEFRRVEDGTVALWYTHLLVSRRGGGLVLEPGASREFRWRVRPRGIASGPLDRGTDFDRWCVDLPAGEYRAGYRFEVGRDFFDPDSHMKLPQLERLAKEENARLWLGSAESNELTVRRGPDTDAAKG